VWTDATTSSYRSVFCQTLPALDAAVNFNCLHGRLYRQRHRPTISDGNVAIEKGARMLQIVLTAPPRLSMRLADALVFFTKIANFKKILLVNEFFYGMNFKLHWILPFVLLNFSNF